MSRTLFDDAEAISASIERDVQRELERAKALRRNTDPETSHEAARHVVRHLGEVQRWVLDIVKQWPGCTASELADAKGIGDIRQINRRLPELEEQGRVRRGEARECAITGRKAATWFPS